MKAGELEAEFGEMGGYTAESDAASLLSELGVEEALHQSLMKDISGAFKVRVLLAQALFGNPDVLILDEPTNNLDVATISWLENVLADYENIVIVVSHDRHFLDAVVTSTLVFEADGQINKHAGGYSDWARRDHALAIADEPTESKRASATTRNQTKNVTTSKLSYKLQRELDALPAQIQALERQVADLQNRLNDPEFYRRPHEEVQSGLANLHSVQLQLDAAFDRWAQLEEQAQSFEGSSAREI